MLESERKNESAIAMKNIVFATDFLESSRLALDYAVVFAHLYGAKLTIVHVFELSPEAKEAEMVRHRWSITREHARARLEAFASGVRRAGITTEVDLRDGEPCASVLASAKENHGDLLVLGTHGVLRGLQHLVVGSNAEKILLSAQCPTLTVGRHVRGGIDLKLHSSEILFISDFTLEAASAAAYALRLGEDLGIPVELLQTAPDDLSSNPQLLQEAAERHCHDLAAAKVANQNWLRPEHHLERIVSCEEVIRRATECANRVLVLGVHGESRWNRHLHTSFAYELVAKASCPLLTIHKPSA